MSVSAIPIDFPQIAVIGSQSSGKSSVLESFIGRDFLPRGTGIVTRCPLVLQLMYHPKNADGTFEEYAEFAHIKGRKFEKSEEVTAEIIRQTDVLTRVSKNISPEPIFLRYHSPNVTTLTLVDLPGLTKVAVAGQPQDIDKQIRDLCYRYVSRPNSVILAVSAANTDIANSDGLCLAKQVDPACERTIGVLTKVDLLGPETDTIDIMNGKIYNLKFGFVSVVNRSQKDIDEKKPIEKSRRDERSFFENHPAYKSRAQTCGSVYLAEKLSTILNNHIRKALPGLRASISSNLQRYTGELHNLGGAPETNTATAIVRLIHEYSTEFRRILDGENTDCMAKELQGAARISHAFFEKYAPSISNMDVFEGLADPDIRTAIHNSSGISRPILMPVSAFEAMSRQQIHKFEVPSLALVQCIYEELSRISSMVLKRPSFKRYPAVAEMIHGHFTTFMEEAMAVTKKLVKDYIDAEAGLIGTSHPQFVSGHRALAMVAEKYTQIGGPDHGGPQQRREPEQPGRPPRKGVDTLGTSLVISGQPTDRESVDLDLIKKLLESYYAIAKQNVAMTVPKLLWLKMIEHGRNELQNHLLAVVYEGEIPPDLLKESDFVVKRRKELVDMVGALKRADQIISTF